MKRILFLLFMLPMLVTGAWIPSITPGVTVTSATSPNQVVTSGTGANAYTLGISGSSPTIGGQPISTGTNILTGTSPLNAGNITSGTLGLGSISFSGMLPGAYVSGTVPWALGATQATQATGASSFGSFFYWQGYSVSGNSNQFLESNGNGSSLTGTASGLTSGTANSLQFPLGKTLVAAGTSITAGYGIGSTNSWPVVMVTGSYGTAFKGMGVINTGSSGNNLGLLIANYNTQIGQYLSITTGTNTSVCVEMGANDQDNPAFPGIAAWSGSLAANIYAPIHASGTNGFTPKVIAVTVLPRYDGIQNPQYEANRQAINAALRAGGPGTSLPWDYLIDVDKMVDSSNPFNYAINPLMCWDFPLSIHPSLYATAILASGANKTLEGLPPSDMSPASSSQFPLWWANYYKGLVIAGTQSPDPTTFDKLYRWFNSEWYQGLWNGLWSVNLISNQNNGSLTNPLGFGGSWVPGNVPAGTGATAISGSGAYFASGAGYGWYEPTVLNGGSNAAFTYRVISCLPAAPSAYAPICGVFDGRSYCMIHLNNAGGANFQTPMGSFVNYSGSNTVLIVSGTLPIGHYSASILKTDGTSAYFSLTDLSGTYAATASASNIGQITPVNYLNNTAAMRFGLHWRQDESGSTQPMTVAYVEVVSGSTTATQDATFISDWKNGLGSSLINGGTITLSSGASGTIVNPNVTAQSVIVMCIFSASGSAFICPSVACYSGSFTATGAATDNSTYVYQVVH